MPTTTLNDTFTGSGNLSAHTSDSGHTWTAAGTRGSTSPTLLADGTLTGAVAGGAFWVAGAVAAADGESCTVEYVWDGTAGGTLAPIVRGGATNAGYAALVGNSTATYYDIQIYRLTDLTLVATSVALVGNHNTGTNLVKLTATGTGASVNLKVTHNGTEVLNVNDTAAARTTEFGKAGVGVYKVNTVGSGLRITNVSAEYPTTTSLTLTGPSSGAVSAASTNFTVTLNSGSADVVFTPTSDAGTGSFSPTSVTLTVASPSATFTYTPTSAGARNISGTNDGGLAAPTPVAYTATSSDSIGQTEQTASRIFQRAEGGTTKSIVFAGTYGGTLPTSVEVKIVNATGGATVQDWTALSATTISGGAWSGSLSVPQGSWYNFLSRTKNGAAVLATAAQSSNSFGVGLLIGVIGQSNAQQMFGTGTIGNAHTKQYSAAGGWATCSGYGAGTVSDRLQVALSIPVGMLHYGVNGAGLYAGPTPWINTNAGSSYDLFKTGLIAVGGDCEFVLWLQGEADAQVPVTKANYKTSLTTLFERIKTDTGRASLKFGCYLLGRVTSAVSIPDWDAIRQGHIEWLRDTSGSFLLGSAVDMPLADIVHFSYAGFERIGRRAAQAVLKQLGVVAFGASGPRILSASRAGAVITIPVTHDAGTALKEADGSTDGGSLTGIEVSNDDFATTLTISSTAISGANIVITLSAVPTGTTKVRYQYGANPVVTNPVYDNTAPGGDTLGLPLQPTIGALTVADGASTSVSISATTDDAIFSGAATVGGGFSGAISDADIARIASAVIAALQATAIPVNIKAVNDVSIKGIGTPANPWNPV